MTAIDDVAQERRRQIDVEGWTAEHDDKMTDRSLALAAAAYAASGALESDWAVRTWPMTWNKVWFKPTTRRRDLVKAAALIVAEIERLDRIIEGNPNGH